MHVIRDDLSPSSLFRKAPVPDSTLPLSTSQSSSLRSSPTRSLPCPESLVPCLVYFDPKSYIVRSRQLLPRRLSRASASTRARIVFYSSSLRVCFFFERNTRRHDLFHGGNEKSSPRRCVVVTFIGLVPSLSGYAIAHRWRVLPRIGRHRASSSQSSSINPGSFLFR